MKDIMYTGWLCDFNYDCKWEIMGLIFLAFRFFSITWSKYCFKGLSNLQMKKKKQHWWSVLAWWLVIWEILNRITYWYTDIGLVCISTLLSDERIKRLKWCHIIHLKVKAENKHLPKFTSSLKLVLFYIFYCHQFQWKEIKNQFVSRHFLIWKLFSHTFCAL